MGASLVFVSTLGANVHIHNNNYVDVCRCLWLTNDAWFG